MRHSEQKAFPSDCGTNIEVGMELRDYFAAKAMQGMLAGLMADPEMDPKFYEIAELSYRISDAMLDERENEDNQSI